MWCLRLQAANCPKMSWLIGSASGYSLNNLILNPPETTILQRVPTQLMACLHLERSSTHDQGS